MRGSFHSKTADDKPVYIHLEAEQGKFPADGPLTHISVRVGVFGDHPVSDRFLDQVGLHLKPVGPPSAPARTDARCCRLDGVPPPTTPPPPLAP